MRNKFFIMMWAVCIFLNCLAGATVFAKPDIDMSGELDIELPLGDMKDIAGEEKLCGEEPDVYFEELGTASEPFGFYNCGSDYGRMCLAEISRDYLECYDDLLEQCEAFASYYLDIDESMVNGASKYFVPKLKSKDYTYSLTLEDITAVIIMLIQDHPEFYWIDSFIYSYYSSDGPYIISLTISEDYALGERRHTLDGEIQRNLEEYVSIAERFRSHGDYITVKAVHDAIINSVDYAYEEIKIGDEYYLVSSTAASAHNIVAVLDDDDETMPVCEGYAGAFQIILNALGIDNIHVKGDSFTELGEEPHAWNLVKLDDEKYYFIDVTWDDQGKKGVFYKYFAKGFGHFSDHIIKVPVDHEGNPLYELPDIPEDDFEIIGRIDKSLTKGVQISASGDCGEKIEWTLYENGLLYIHGSGDMYDFDFDYKLQISEAPWYKYASDINFVLIDNGVENIGMFAFWKCSRILDVYISDGLERIGSYVFGNCWNMGAVRLPETINGFEPHAFEYCSSINDIYYGGNEEQWRSIDKSEANIPDDVIMHFSLPAPVPGGGYQYTINDLQITGGRAEIDLAEDNNAGTACLMLAAYDNGVFKFLLKKEAEVGKVIFDDDRIDDSLAYKAVVWDSLDGQKPVAECR